MGRMLAKSKYVYRKEPQKKKKEQGRNITWGEDHQESSKNKENSKSQRFQAE